MVIPPRLVTQTVEGPLGFKVFPDSRKVFVKAGEPPIRVSSGHKIRLSLKFMLPTHGAGGPRGRGGVQFTFHGCHCLPNWSDWACWCSTSLSYVPFFKVGAELLFEVVSRAYERTSLLATTNLPFT